MSEMLSQFHPMALPLLTFLVLIVAAIVVDLIVKNVLLRILTSIIRANRLGWDDVLARFNVFGRLAQIVPALIIYIGVELIPELSDSFVQLVRSIALAYLILAITLTLNAVLSTANAIYEQNPVSHSRPLRGFVQLFQLVLSIVGGILILSSLIDRSPLLLLSGFGAMTAVVLLVFKDTILGLVASVQLNANDMVRIGDWIEIPQYGADGDVVEVGLHTVKVQNFDRTITTIPTYRLISESFKNWRGMSESGGRRIKRALYIDTTSIRFLSDEDIDRFDKYRLLRSYLESKRGELSEDIKNVAEDAGTGINRRRLTNVGTFRAYVLAYLQSHSEINPNATLLVRQLAPSERGLPLEIYCFTRTTQWQKYEDVQSDIFDHLMAATLDFDLRLFQDPAGSDIRSVLAAEQIS